eukprot:4374637-Amphidinium_carterae.1
MSNTPHHFTGDETKALSERQSAATPLVYRPNLVSCDLHEVGNTIKGSQRGAPSPQYSGWHCSSSFRASMKHNAVD